MNALEDLKLIEEIYPNLATLEVIEKLYNNECISDKRYLVKKIYKIYVNLL